ncbi:hypothetical protein DRJ58_01810 [Candidatus Acetothermia bacterium]|nr:MAG: hypothetical protein DRJ27_04920 [Candidatus Acetothermia bacterium]RLE34492.1 MAG: hypothetical protein DRJ58_01810 [Candidatus Acetothermia bacterium]
MRLYVQRKKVITQIGSLPLRDPKAAVKYSLRHDIPFLPELPLLGDAMLSYIKDPGHLSTLAEFKKHRFDSVKVQVIGPATLILSGYDPDEALLRIYRHVEAIMEGLRAEEVILFLDEPALGQAGFDFEELWRPIFSDFPVIPGVHVCGNMQWDLLFKSDVIEIISFDASRYDITRYYPRHGKRIAWGITDPSQIKDFHPGDLITPPCGLSPKFYDHADLERVLATLLAAKDSVGSGR